MSPRWSLCAPVLAIAVIPTVAGPGAQRARSEEVEPIVLSVDPTTKAPTGPIEKPRGPLLDPRDLPKPVRAFFPRVDGLEGLELSLTVLLARHLGFVVEQKKLDAAYRPHCEALRDNWNEELARATAALDPEDPTQRFGAVLYQDTGRRPSDDFTEVRIVAAPEIRLAPMSTEAFDRFVRCKTLIAALGPDMSKEDAEELHALTMEKMDAGEIDVGDNPWFGHASNQAFFLSTGMYSKELVENNPFKITPEEFFRRCRQGLERGLISVPELDAEVRKGHVFYEEGLAVVRIAPDAEASWDAPADLLELNERAHVPVLLVTVSKEKKYGPKAKVKRARLAMIAGGKEVELFEGALPFR